MKKIFFTLALMIVLSSGTITAFTDTMLSITDAIEEFTDTVEDLTDTILPTDDSAEESTDEFSDEEDLLIEAVDELMAEIRQGHNETDSEQEGFIPVPTEYIIDNASLLTDEQTEKFEAQSAKIRENYDFDVVILTVPDLSGKTPMAYAEDFYINSGYNQDGIIFLVSMAERDWNISAFDHGLSVFTLDYGIPYISDNVLAALSDENYTKSFSKFLNYADAFLLEADSGTPYSTDNAFIEKNTMMIFAAIGALVIAFAVVAFMAYSMNTKRPKDLAHEYVNRESINETERNDLFLYRTVTKTEKQKDDDDDDDDKGSRSGGLSGKF